MGIPIGRTMALAIKPTEDASPQDRIALLVSQADDVVRKAQRHKKSLTGSNFYADKLAELRANAANALRELIDGTVGSTSPLPELIGACFSSSSIDPRRRLESRRALLYELKTQRKFQPSAKSDNDDQELFPLSILVETNRPYLVSIGRQINGCYSSGWYDACAVMVRRLLETSIIEAFEQRGLAAKIKDSKGDFSQLSDLISAALAEGSWNLSRNTRTHLPKLKDVGHTSAHGRYFHARKEDIDKVEWGARVTVEEFLRLAKLL